MINICEERKWIADTNNERFEVVEDKGIHYNTHYFIIQYDTDGRKQTVRKQDLEEKTVILPPQIHRNRLINDLDDILKDVSIFKIIKVVDELIQKGWNFKKE
mgnify:CR=1 FL=1